MTATLDDNGVVHIDTPNGTRVMMSLKAFAFFQNQPEEDIYHLLRPLDGGAYYIPGKTGVSGFSGAGITEGVAATEVPAKFKRIGDDNGLMDRLRQNSARRNRPGHK